MSDKQSNASDDVVDDEVLELDDESTDEDVDDEELGGEDDDESSEDTIEIDGESYTKEEVLAWKSENMMDRDYRQKTMALADEKRKLNEEHSVRMQELDEQINVLEAAITLGDGYTDEELDDLADEDPRLFRKIEKQRKAREAALNDARKKYKKAYEERVPVEQQALIAAMPEWNDPKKGDATYKRDNQLVAAYMAELGFTQKEAKEMIDNRVMRAMIHGARYMNLKNSKPTKKTPKPKPSKTGSKKGSAQEQTFAQALYG